MLLPLLHDLQKAEGHLSGEMISEVSSHLKIPVNKIYGVATFYDHFSFRNRGKYHFRVCRGTACHIFMSSTFINVLEKELKVKTGNTSKDGKFSLEIVSCLGACGNAPVMAINDKFYSGVSPETLTAIISSLKS